MIGYVMLGTNDLARAARFYDALLGAIGATRQVEYESAISWGVSAHMPTLEITEPYDKNPATVGNGVMVALAVGDRAQVQSVHRKALELGGKDEGAPGSRDGSGFYGGYFRDLDGNKLAAFCME